MRYLDEFQRKQIGFSYILDNVQTVTPMGYKEKKSIEPYGLKNQNLLIKELDYCDLILSNLVNKKKIFDNIGERFCRIKDISNSIKRLMNGLVLDDIELFELKFFAKLSNEIMKEFSHLNISIEYLKFMTLDEVFDLLDPEKKGLATFHIYDEYSPLLHDIRLKKSRIESLILHTTGNEKKDQLLDERIQFVIQEEEEEQKIRIELSKKLRPFAENILGNILTIGKVDFLIAKCQLFQERNAIKPKLSNGNHIKLKNASNPMVKDILAKKNKIFTEISIDMDKGVTLITGANMGGKSISINTITLNVLLAQMGFFVFAKEAILPVYDFVYFISDDLQSVERGLSTFGAEMIQLKKVIGAIRTTKGFVALDELARGTNPTEGKDIVQALIFFMKDKAVNALISTHYDGIDAEEIQHYQVVGLKNLNFEKLKNQISLNKTSSIDILQNNMDYHLELVNSTTVPKDALNIAALLGLDQEILQIIETFYKE